jgi:hypothetical protein
MDLEGAGADWHSFGCDRMCVEFIGCLAGEPMVAGYSGDGTLCGGFLVLCCGSRLLSEAQVAVGKQFHLH